MKNFLKYILLNMIAVLSIFTAYLGVQSLRLNWWGAPERVTLEPLSPELKAEDMRYLLDLTRRVSQADAVWQAAGLDNPLDQPEAWVRRAQQSASNAEFADHILQFLVHAGQGGHAFLAYDANFNSITSLVSDIPKEAFAKMLQWSRVTSQMAWYAHANLNLIYRAGAYVLDHDTQVDGITLPAGAVVEKVDGRDVDAFVLQQQYRAHLRYDPALGKFYLYPLLNIDPGPDQPGWELVFRLLDGDEQTVFVQKIPGYVAHRPDESRMDNIRCLAVNEGLLYIKIQTFYREYAVQDGPALAQCFASGDYQKAILDVRGNNGGEIWSYMDNILSRLARETVTYQTTAMVKDSFYQWYGWRFWLFKVTNNNELSDPLTHIQSVERINYPPYSQSGWRVMQVTRQIEPSTEPFPFDGQVYVLTDNNTLSAGDSFAAAVRSTGLAKTAGANTAGWGQAYQAKMLYALPNSGLLFYLDAELTLNPDGALDNYVGVAPGVVLDASTYPTPYPAQITRQALLEDPWVQWVMADQAAQ